MLRVGIFLLSSVSFPFFFYSRFYKALNQRDLGGMRRVWLEGSDCEVQCTHPLFEVREEQSAKAKEKTEQNKN